MTEFFKSTFRIFQLRGGQNGQLLDTFLRELQQSGFAKITVRRHIRTAEHLLYWARLKGISLSAFNEDTVDEFARHLTRCRCKGYGHKQRRGMQMGARLFIASFRRIEIPLSRLSAAAEDPQILQPCGAKWQ